MLVINRNFFTKYYMKKKKSIDQYNLDENPKILQTKIYISVYTDTCQ